MSGPIVLVSHLNVREGKLEAFKQSSREVFEIMEATKPGTLVHVGYANEEGSKVSFIHLFPDAQAMDDHMKGVEDRAAKAFEFLETTGYEVYGSPSEGAMRTMEKFASSGIPLSVESDYFGGYMRLASG